MFYEPNKPNQILKRSPIKSFTVPRPIAWVSTISKDGISNLAPYSQFQNLTFDPYYIMISINQDRFSRRKDTTVNIEETGEFVCNMVSYDFREAMNITAAPFPPEDDEFEKAGLKKLPSKLVKPFRVKGSPVQIECKYIQTIRLPGKGNEGTVDIIIGEVIGIHIEDKFITADNKIDIAAIKPLARLGYSDFTYVEKVFEMKPSEAVCSAEEVISALEGAGNNVK